MEEDGHLHHLPGCKSHRTPNGIPATCPKTAVIQQAEGFHFLEQWACSKLWNKLCFYMIIIGFEIVSTLIAREKRDRPQQGRTLERRISAWKREVEQARWVKPTDVKAVYGTADIVGDNRVVFDICGNTYRLVVQFNYIVGNARIRFAGTHPEYDKIDARTI
jgi:mRNA interferase HigB